MNAINEGRRNRDDNLGVRVQTSGGNSDTTYYKALERLSVDDCFTERGKYTVMKKYIILIAFISLVFSIVLTGCTKAASDNNRSDGYTSAQREFEFLVNAIEKKDNATIKDKFSTYACDHIDDIDKKINRLIEEFPGYDGGVTIKDTFERRSNYGKITNIYTPSFDFIVDDATYRMRIIYYVEADEEPDKMGWYSVQLYKRHDSGYSSDMYTHGVKDNPDILLWDYTKDN